LNKKKLVKESNADDDEYLVDLLLDSNLNLSEIAKELDVSINFLNKRINHLGLNWAKKSKRKMSRGQTALTMIMKKLLPGEDVINEYHIGDRLKLDVYCPSFRLAAEYHGRQHFYYTSRFFDSIYDFEEAKKRDEKKVQYCKDNGIALIVFRYNDSLTEKSVYDRMLDAIRNTPIVEVQKKESITSSDYYQSMKKRNSEYRKKIYREMKEKRVDDSRKRSE